MENVKEKINGTVNLARFKFEEKKRKAVQAAKELPGKTMKFIEDHKEVIIATAPVALYAIKKMAKIGGEMAEDRRQKMEIYDFSLHRWCYLKRPMRPREELEYKRRRANGESVYDILNIMHLLKY